VTTVTLLRDSCHEGPSSPEHNEEGGGTTFLLEHIDT